MSHNHSSNSGHATEPPPVTATVTPTKICCKCARSLPVTEFRRRRRDSDRRMTTCRTCHTAQELVRRHKHNTRRVGWQIQKAASQISRSKNLHRTEAILEQLVEAVGGVSKLIDHWREQCLLLSHQRRSSTRLARMYECLITMAGQIKGAKNRK